MRRRVLLFLASGLVLVLLAAYLVARQIGIPMPWAGGCVVRAEGSEVTLDQEQAANAATIAAVGIRRQLPERAVTIALATAWQESQLRNIDHGDRDSLGLFQQRPSQGWGTPEQITDPVYATNKFYDALVEIDGYTRLPLTEAAQEVQRSGYPQAYAKHETASAVMAAALTGRVEGGLTCTLSGPRSLPEGELNEVGLQPRAERVREALARDFGELPLGGFEPGGVNYGHGSDSAHYDGRAIDVFFRPIDDENQRHGWAVAQWAMAHAEELDIATVIYDGKIWTQLRSAQGWRDYQVSPDAPGDRDILMHRDHVHLDVIGQ
ncbi:hypothetical protein FHU37_005115 [Allostreptomyces psammosilenae]|uniref:ARB-07466-like C-terminal domain-containing protein n=1 Tax=Allostreptomyces psammosilenae TaxID=1892865 RepID=A0A853A0I1_9ACTN|nr:hypothetical protein [Allostreptomyces psammosilenae]NYI08086.1 hypothetical protein [Allostreptomyces psammosilenae]